MKKISQSIVFFGTEAFSACNLRALHDAEITVDLIITKPDSARGRNLKKYSPEVKQLAEEYRIDCLQPHHIDEIIPFVQKLEDPIGVLVSYGKIIPRHIIDLFPQGIINVHPSLLPKYRGPSPIESAILHGDSQTGVSIMKIATDMDAGPIFYQTSLSLSGTETKLELYETLGKMGAEMLVEILPRIISGECKLQKQDDTAATYCKLLSKKDSELNPATMSAEYMERHVRAFLGFPRSRLTIHEQNCIILKAYASSHLAPRKLSIPANNGGYLIIEELMTPHGKTMSGEAFLRGFV